VLAASPLDSRNSGCVLSHKGLSVISVAFPSDGWLLASGYMDNTVGLWGVRHDSTAAMGV
jgi:WD40 repeat protein